MNGILKGKFCNDKNMTIRELDMAGTDSTVRDNDYRAGNFKGGNNVSHGFNC